MAEELYGELDNAKDQIRILHLFPKNTVKRLKKKDEIVKAQDVQHEGQEEIFAIIQKGINDLTSQSAEVNTNTIADSLKRIVAGIEAYEASERPQPSANSMNSLVNTKLEPQAPNPTKLGETESQSIETYKLAGSLEVVSLQDNPEYTALSYVWGDATHSSTILINDVEVEITESLAIALEHIQTSNDTITLWIDGICINQTNNAEKTEQVMKMKRIYQSASLVLTWLGPAADQSDVIMELVENTGPSFLKNGSAITVLSDISEGPDELQDLLEANPSLKEIYNMQELKIFVEGLRSLFHREYWHRIWILQELVFAKSVIIVCGSKRASLDAFELVGVLLIKLFTWSKQYFWSTKNWWELKNIKAWGALNSSQSMFPAVQMLKERRRCQQPNQERKLADILTMVHTLWGVDTRLRATNPRDKIYALLGLAADANTLNIYANYEESIETTYIKTARELLSRDLGLLLLAQQKIVNNNAPRTVPSWVPDWRLDINESPNFCAFQSGSFRASGQLQHQHHNSSENDSQILAVSGSKVDTVTCVGAVFCEEDGIKGAVSTPFLGAQLLLSQIENYCYRSARMIPSVYGDSDRWVEQAIYSIPVCDQEVVEPNTMHRRRLTIESQPRYKKLLALFDCLNDMLVSNSNTEVLEELLKSDLRNMLSYFLMMYRAIGWRPFLTQNGYVGLGPGNLRHGDIICIFAGANVPHIIRKHESDNHTLIGDAYVHGIMDGELVKKGLKLETFLLV